MVHAGKGGGRMFVNAARIHGRKSNFSLLEYMQSEVRAYESPVPAWMPACLLAPPMTIPNVPHPGKLTYPEDALRKVWFDRHPEARKIKLKTVYVGEHRYWQHPATSFVSRQIKLINKGIDEQEAYSIVEEEDKQEARYRELERIVAIEQAKELGFEDLETARDLLAPPDLTQARERMLEELIEVVKLKGIPNVVPELLPKGMKWREVLAFVHKYPQYAHYFSLDFMATHAITSGNPEIADAFMWIYGGEEISDEPSPEELEEIEAFVDSAYGTSGDAGDDDDDVEEDSAHDMDTIENAASGFAAELIGGTLEDEEGFFEEDDNDREGSRGDEEGDEPEAGEKFGEDQMSPEEQAAEAAEEAERIASIEEDGRKFQAIMARIERVYRPEQYPPTNDTAWANLVSLLALRPKAPNVKLARKAEDMVKAEKAKRAAGKAKRSTGGAKSKGKEVELQ